MKTERVIRLLEIEKLYALKQTGHSQKPINKEVRQALDIAIEAVKQSENTISRETYDAWLKSVKALAEADVVPVVRCKDCIYNGDDLSCPLLCIVSYTEGDEYCCWGKRRTDNE